MDYAYDPEIAAVVPSLPEGDYTDIAAGRAMLEQVLATMIAGLDTSGVTIRDELVPGRDGAPDIPVRVFTPDHLAAPALIFDIHGGGFTHGHLDADHIENVGLARDLGVTIVAVDYRLAPESPFPAGLNDCYTALEWTVENASRLGIDPGRIALLGESVGAGLCAGLTLMWRDRGGPAIAFQFLKIPVLDDHVDTLSARAFTDTPMWTGPSAAASWDFYLGPGLRGTDQVSSYAAPAREADLKGLPPAYISVMEFDPLRDEGIAYAQALLSAGVPVELHLFPGAFHGALSVAPHAALAQRSRTEQCAVLSRALGISA